VVRAYVERGLVVGAEHLQAELRRGPQRVKPTSATGAAVVGRVGEREIALAGGWRAGDLELLALEVMSSVDRLETEQRPIFRAPVLPSAQ
jgi:hypothetical protein